MSLKITLKPHERLILGGAVISNGDKRADLIVENNVPILREKDILNEQNADSACKRIYLVIQLMYIDRDNILEHHKTYWELVKDVLSAAPSMKPLITEISELLLDNNYYKALKVTKKLIDYEQEVINNVYQSTGQGI